MRVKASIRAARIFSQTRHDREEKRGDTDLRAGERDNLPSEINELTRFCELTANQVSVIGSRKPSIALTYPLHRPRLSSRANA